ncbi:MAG: glycosyltransferase [Desulfobacteraceae bacterium]|nr:glycosyltransferase [Desulfobacteraceae bacterium]
MDPEISIIVPTYNGATRISACIEALLVQQTGRKYEIIIVDDGSTDNTCDIVKKYVKKYDSKALLIVQNNAGPASARNHGVEKASGEIVLFTDDDCIAEPDWLENMLTPFEDSDVVGTKGTYLTNQKELIARFVQIEYEEKYDELSKHQYIDFLDTYSAAFRRKIFLDNSGYDTSFSTASVEDQEFSFRLANMGYKMVFAPKAKVWHTHVKTISGYIQKKYKIGYWKLLLLAKNPNKITGDSHTPASLKMQVLLTGILFFSLIFLVISPWGFVWLLIIATIFLVTMMPLVIRCLLRDPCVGMLAPLFIICRSVGLTAGLIKGFFGRFILSRN